MLFVYLPAYVGRRTLDALKSVKLETLHDDGLTLEFADVLENGPDGGSGVIAGWGELGKITAYRPASQVWHKVVKQTLADGTVLDAGRAWIGWDRDDPPTPENLARRKQMTGSRLRLADGHEWLIPIARHLPMLLGLADDETVSRTVIPQYRKFWQDSYGMLTHFTTESAEVGIDPVVGIDYCASALAVNYRMNRDLASCLSLLDSHLFWEIPKIVCEYDKLAEWVEKKNPSAT